MKEQDSRPRSPENRRGPLAELLPDDLESLKLAGRQIAEGLRAGCSQEELFKRLEQLRILMIEQADKWLGSADLDRERLKQRIQQYWRNLVIVIRWMSTLPANFEGLLNELVEAYWRDLKATQANLRENLQNEQS